MIHPTIGARTAGRFAGLLLAAALFPTPLPMSLPARAATVPGADTSGADASAAPFVTPQCDVDVTYSVAAPDPAVPAIRQRMRWSSATLRQRVDPAGSATYMLTDYRARTLTVIDLARNVRTTIPAPGSAVTRPGQRAPGSWIHGATMLVAGQPCTAWQTADTDGQASEVCYSDDGVMLQATRNGHVMVRAETVRRTAQPDAVFAIPAGLRDLPAAHP
ncbi:hypothetical protein AAC691_20170 [Nguyenibacter vanlangensis]|uniref:DUF4412 domain-containing protein n=1 Tax=Nguyenibacter vanlangensis TaxID=1216886 RepID=A0ABZ3D4Y4_9PROT